MTPTDWTAAKVGELERELARIARLVRKDPYSVAEDWLDSASGSAAPFDEAVFGQAALALQTQRNLLAAANARIAELEADLRDANTRPVA